MALDLHELMLDYLAALNRHVIFDDDFADQLAEMASMIEPGWQAEGFAEAMLNISRLHRVAAIKSRALTVGVNAEYDARFGASKVDDEP